MPSSIDFVKVKRVLQKTVAATMCAVVGWCPIGIQFSYAATVSAYGSATKDKKYDEMTDEEKAEYDAAQKAEAESSLTAGKQIIETLQESYEQGKTSEFGPQTESDEEAAARAEELRQTGKDATEIGKEYGEAAAANLPTISGTTLSFPIFNQGKGETLTIDQNSFAPSSETNSNITYSSSMSDINGQQANYNDGNQLNNLGSAAKAKLFELAGKDKDTVGTNIEAEVFKLLNDTKGLSKQFDLDEDVLFTASNTILNNIGDAIGNIYNCKTETITHSYEETVQDAEEYTCYQTERYNGTCYVTHNFQLDSWGGSDSSCLAAAFSVDRDFCEKDETGQRRCYNQGTVVCVETAQAGSTVDGVVIDPSKLQDSPFPSINKLCKKIQVTVNADADNTEMECYQTPTNQTDEKGNLIYKETCPGVNTGTNVDTCQKYVEKGCEFVKSECSDNGDGTTMQGDSGTCYQTEVTYRCNNENRTFLKESTETVTTCDGLTCYGDDCITTETTDNTDFQKAVALLDAASYMANDISCADDSKDIGGCKFLTGDNLKCKIALGGWQDCCDPNSSFGLRKFMKIVGVVLKVWEAVSMAYDMAADMGYLKQYYVNGQPMSQADYEKWMDANGYTNAEDVGGALDGGTYLDQNGNWAGTGYAPASKIDAYNWKFSGITNFGYWAKTASDVAQVVSNYGTGVAMTRAFTTGVSNAYELFKQTSYYDALNKTASQLKDLAMTQVEILKQYAVGIFKAVAAGFMKTAAKIGGEAALNYFKEDAAKKIGEEAGKEVATDAATQTGEQAVASSAVESTAMNAVMAELAAVFTVIMWIYIVYQIVNMIVSLVYACEDEEIELQAKLDTKVCHYVGSYCKQKVLKKCIVKMKSYCCFSSPLARILNQEIRKQSGTGLNWGDPKNPDCAGIPISVLESVDWDAIDLSEWISLLNTTDNMPNSSNINMEERTGTGSALAHEEDREDSEERQTSKLDGADIDGLRKAAGEQIIEAGNFIKKGDFDEDGNAKVDYEHTTCRGECGETGGYLGGYGSCVCYPDCNSIVYCQFGGSPYKDQYACYCYASPWCSGPEICPYGGTPKGDGSQDCECNAPPNCWDQCEYGGVAVGDGSQACTCNSKPTGMEACAKYCQNPGSPYHGDVDWNYNGYDMFCTVDGDNCHFKRKLWRKKKCINKRKKAAQRQAEKCNQIEGVQCTSAWLSSKHGVFGCNVQSTICTGTCEYGGIWNKDTHSCDCNPNICETACDWNGVPVTNGTQACSCYPEPSKELQACADACEAPNEESKAFSAEAHFRKDGYDLLCEIKGKDPTTNAEKADEIVRACKQEGLKCTFGWSDENDGDGSGFFGCIDELEKCNSECTYGGVAADDGSCTCKTAPVCEGPKEQQTGSHYCPYGGKAYGNGSQDCSCNQEPTCNSFCPYGGTPNADGTQGCTCGVVKDCSTECADYGGTFMNGACDCIEAPECNDSCSYGGEPLKDGTDECLCYDPPVCTGAFGTQTGTTFCQYGGEARGDDDEGNGTRDCECNAAPACDSATLCPYGGQPAADGTDACSCYTMPICTGTKDQQTGDNYCTYGGIAKADGTRACQCSEETNCNAATNCPYGGTALGDGTGGCSCNSAPKCETQCPDWGGTPLGNGTQNCVCNGAPQCKSACSYGGDVSKTTANGVTTETCVCREAPDCTAAGICPYGGTPKADGTSECSCNPAPICDKSVCPYGGEPAADGTQQCACLDAPNCNNSLVCQYGGTPKANGTQNCSCNEKPTCEGVKQTGSNYCTYGGKPTADGTNSCVCNSGTDCDECDLGGTPLKNGTQACTCTTSTTCATSCDYGGEPKENGTTECICYSEPDCSDTQICLYGGTPKKGGTQECNCNAGPVCVGDQNTQTGTNFCKFGGTPKGNGTMYCVCNETPKCGSDKCPYGGSPKADGTDACECKEAPDCSDSKNCPYGGTPTANGTQACACAAEPSCAKQCPDYGGTPAKDGTQNCVCNAAPNCKEQCTYGGLAATDGTTSCLCDPKPNCDITSCLYGGGPKADGTQECACNDEPNCAFKCDFGGTPAADGTQTCVCNESPDCNVAEVCPYGGHAKNDGTDACVCNAAPSCATKCLYGGTPKGDGSQDCSCYGTDVCSAKCEYGGTIAKTPEEFQTDCNAACAYGGDVTTSTMNGVATSSCTCRDAPVCSGAKDVQTGLNYCTYGGVAAGNGSAACACNDEPTTCSAESICAYGGKPAADGTSACTCFSTPNCVKVCTEGYGGAPKADGTQSCDCNDAPNCADVCEYGGEPKKNGTTDCSCSEAPDCETACPYGGTPKADGTQSCDCVAVQDCTQVCDYGGAVDETGTCQCAAEPNCTDYTVCLYGGSPEADGTQNCGCWTAPDCTQLCPYGGYPASDGTQSCVCNKAPNCAEQCSFGGTAVEDGSDACSCNNAPVCAGAKSVQTGSNYCEFGGRPAYDGTQSCVCNGTPDCDAKCTYGGTAAGEGGASCICSEAVERSCSITSSASYETKKEFSCQVKTRTTDVSCVYPVVPNENKIDTVSCKEGVGGGDNASCSITVTPVPRDVWTARCERPIYASRKKNCTQKLVIDVTQTCTPGVVTSSVVTDYGFLGEDAVPGADTLKLAYTCTATQFPILEIWTNSRTRGTPDRKFKTSEAIFDFSEDHPGATLRLAGTFSCGEDNQCAAKVTMTVFRGSGRESVRVGEISASLNFTSYTRIINSETWQEVCE